VHIAQWGAEAQSRAILRWLEVVRHGSGYTGCGVGGKNVSRASGRATSSGVPSTVIVLKNEREPRLVVNWWDYEHAGILAVARRPLAACRE